MKTLLAIILLLCFTACFGQKPAKYDMTATEAIELMQAHERAVLSQQQAQIEARAYGSTADAIRKAHNWPDDLTFNGKEWVKSPPSQKPSKAVPKQ
jgi:hypothetical protein